LQGYRRSFDIGGTSPTLGAYSPSFGSTPRLSLDSRVSTHNTSISSRTGSRLNGTSIPKVDEGTGSDAVFEDVKLEDDEKIARRTLLNRFGFGQRCVATTRKKDGEELQCFKMDN
jgi:hypothetical protein